MNQHRFCAAVLLLLPLVLAAAFAAPAAAQAPAGDKPSYITTMQAVSGSYKNGTASFLGKPYNRSISWSFYATGADCRFRVPEGYTRFVATAGVDDSSQEKDGCTFSVIGIGDDGVEHILATEDAMPLQKPQEINVPLAGMHLLILRLNALKSTGSPYYGAWWGDPRFVSAAGDTGAAAPSSGAVTRLVVGQEDMEEQMLALAKKLKAGALTGSEEVSVGLFTLVPLPGETLADANALSFQKALVRALILSRVGSILPTKAFLSRALPGSWAPGDELDDAMRAALRKNVDTRYALLGAIADRADPDQVSVSAALYDLRTGKSPTDEQRVRVPLQRRETDAPPSPPGEKIPVTLVFAPGENLHISRYQWTVDGQAKSEKQMSDLNSQTVLVPPDGKPHAFVLRWSGSGAKLKPIIQLPFSANKVSYKTVTVEFTVTVSAATNIELSAKVDEVAQSLDLSVRAGDLDIKPKWH